MRSTGFGLFFTTCLSGHLPVNGIICSSIEAPSNPFLFVTYFANLIYHWLDFLPRICRLFRRCSISAVVLRAVRYATFCKNRSRLILLVILSRDMPLRQYIGSLGNGIHPIKIWIPKSFCISDFVGFK